MESEQVTGGRTAVQFIGDVQELTASLNRVAQKFAQFSEPIEQARRLAKKVSIKPETVEQWKVVKPAFENAPPHVKRRLGDMTISQAFAVLARSEEDLPAAAFWSPRVLLDGEAFAQVARAAGLLT